MGPLSALILAHGLFTPPTIVDSSMEIGLAALTVMDVGQTEWSLTHKIRVPVYNNPAYRYTWVQPYEGNFILGRNPSKAKLFGLAAGALAGHALIAWGLWQPWRAIWQAVGIYAEGFMVAHNAMVGVNFNMSF